MPEPTSLFEPVDDRCWQPTELARGPWDPRALHGGPVAALVAHAIEQDEAPSDAAPMHPARLTIELLRPVPLEPLSVTTEVVRPGRRVQLVAATVAVAASGVEVTRALALRIRENPDANAAASVTQAEPDGRVAGEDRLPPGPVQGAAPEAFFLPTSEAAAGAVTAFHSHAVEHRFVEGRFDERGAATDWIRLRVRVVPHRDPSPWQRAAAAADFGNGISGILDPARLNDAP